MDYIKHYISPTRIGASAASIKSGDQQGSSSGHSSASTIKQLTATFFAWKTLLLLLVCAAPGPGDDTSTQLAFGPDTNSRSTLAVRIIQQAAVRLTRWDAIYFTKSSERGYVYEQEWAFSWAFASLMSLTAKVIPLPTSLPDIYRHAVAGIMLASTSHLLSVFLLFYIAKLVLPYADEQRRSRTAIVVATLHILSPAGVFLSAPYGESTFAMFNFAGMLCYVLATRSRLEKSTTLNPDFLIVATGLNLGLASMIRSNGLLSGIVLFWDALRTLQNLRTVFTSLSQIRHLCAVVLAGVLVAAGFALPQILGYQEYCTIAEPRPWCSNIPPSIYTFIQDEYWNVGFLRYWTLSNLPLFLLATPMLVIMTITAFAELSPPCQPQNDKAAQLYYHCMRRFALPQLVLAFLALTSFHVQIITRISSGYPVWYLIIAKSMQTDESPSGTTLLGTFLGNGKSEWIVRGMIIYSIVQGGLYASFLPPA